MSRTPDGTIHFAYENDLRDVEEILEGATIESVDISRHWNDDGGTLILKLTEGRTVTIRPGGYLEGGSFLVIEVANQDGGS